MAESAVTRQIGERAVIVPLDEVDDPGFEVGVEAFEEIVAHFRFRQVDEQLVTA